MRIIHRMFRNQTLFLQGHTPGGATSINARLEAMRANGMSATAIRRALGLSEMQAVACGLVVPASARPASSRLGAGEAAGANMMDVVVAVAHAGGLRPKDLVGRGQTRALARARQLAMHLLHEIHPGVSMHAIGYLLDRDHTTVLYGCRRAEALLARGGAFRERYQRARRELASLGRRATWTGRTTGTGRPTGAGR